MSFEFQGVGGYFVFRQHSWPEVTDLARDYGWTPSACYELMPDGKHIDLNRPYGYWSNEGQVILPDDAAALAEALEKALADSAIRPRARKLAQRIEDVGGRTKLSDFVAYCRKGAFQIF